MWKEKYNLNNLPLLFSEKTFLLAKSYSSEKDPFVGLIEGQLKPFVQKKHLIKAYEALIFSKTTFRLLFEKKGEDFFKSLQAPVFKEMKEFKNEETFLVWKSASLDFETGPLQEMAIYRAFFKTILCFKFHHLILDGFSLFLFFKELSDLYHKSVAGIELKPTTDLESYRCLMENIWKQERENKERKCLFWEKRIKQYQAKSPPQQKNSDENKLGAQKLFSPPQWRISENQVYQGCSENIFLERKTIRKIYQWKSKENVGFFYLFSSLYSKILQERLEINNLCLRAPFSSRYHLNQDNQKKLLASLSRSLPLFVNKGEQSLKERALDIQKQVRSAREHLIMDKSPWKVLNSFSAVKNKNLNLSMSYLPYEEKSFLGWIQSFCWQKSFLDLVLFITLSEKRVLLSFSYKPEVFLKKEIQNLARDFQREAMSL